MVKGEALLFLAGHFFFKEEIYLTHFLLLQLVASNVPIKPFVTIKVFSVLEDCDRYRGPSRGKSRVRYLSTNQAFVFVFFLQLLRSASLLFFGDRHLIKFRAPSSL